jgi:nitrate reductase NapAB chaperone NapD
MVSFLQEVVNIMPTYRQSIGTSQLRLQTIGVGLRNTRLVGVVEADNANQAKESSDEASEVEETLAGRDVGILLGTEDTEDFVILMHRLAKVALFLRIPPATVRVSVCTLHSGRVRVVVVLSPAVRFPDTE